MSSAAAAASSPLRWGFFGAGKITSDFVSVVRAMPKSHHLAYGVASRDADRAKLFAEKHGVAKAFGSYGQLVEDPQVDVVYIGTVNSEHFEQAKLAISGGKHVLVEKPICVNYGQCRELVQRAKDNSVFLMEGFWTLAFPAAAQLFREVRQGAIGEVVTMSLEIGRGGDFGRLDRFRVKDLGGGVLLNHGVYGLMLSYLLLGYPDKIQATGHLSPSGIDTTLAVALSYNDKACVSSLLLSCRATLDAVLRICGDAGNATLPYPFWAPDRCVINSHTTEHPRPQVDVNYSEFNYPYGNGFVYEIEEVRRCLVAGLKESPLVPLDASLAVMRMADEIRRQVGYLLPQDLEYGAS